MAKLTINIGLPASGKSTESEKKILAEGNRGAVPASIKEIAKQDGLSYKG